MSRLPCKKPFFGLRKLKPRASRPPLRHFEKSPVPPDLHLFGLRRSAFSRCCVEESKIYLNLQLEMRWF